MGEKNRKLGFVFHYQEEKKILENLDNKYRNKE